MYDFLDKIGLKAVLEAVKGKIPSSLPANGGNAETVGGKSASDFVEALTLSQSANTRVIIPDNVDVTNWLIENAKIGTVYYINQNSQGQTNLPPVANISWVWFSFDGNRYLARVMINDFSTRDFLLDKVNSVGGWKEISTTPIKSEEFTASTDSWSHIQLFSTSENKKPLAVTFTNTPRTYSVFSHDGYCYLELYNNSMQTIPNTSVSFVLYYMEV